MVFFYRVEFEPDKIRFTFEGTEPEQPRPGEGKLEVYFDRDPNQVPTADPDGYKYYGTLRVHSIGSVSGGSYEIPEKMRNPKK